MKRRLKKFVSLIICCVILLAGTVILGSCQDSSENQDAQTNLREKCQVVFDYVGEDYPIHGYEIEELTICNQNIGEGRILFDEGIAYRVSLYCPLGAMENYCLYFFLGTLNGETVLYSVTSRIDNGGRTQLFFLKRDLTKVLQNGSR